jgi:hypothetical protein
MLKGLAIKKSVFAQEQNRADVARRREQRQKYQGRIDAKRLVFIDETWTKTNMTPLRGWGPCGARVKGRAPFGRWKTMTFIGALRHDRIEAPCLFDGPINGLSFLAYVQDFLVPNPQSWRRGDPGQSRQSSGQGRSTGNRSGRCQAPLLAEILARSEPQVFSKLKHLLRKAQARSYDAVFNAIAQLLAEFSSKECGNYLTNSGYRVV